MLKNVLIKTTAATAIDCTHIAKVTGIAIDFTEPSGSTTRFLLSVDGGKWRKYSNGVWSFATEQDLTADSVLDEGNTKDELSALTETELTAFAGKIIDVAVAIKIEDETNLPSLNTFIINGSNTRIDKNIIFSDVLKLGEESVGIAEIDVNKTESSGGAINLYASVQKDTGEWSDYVDYEDIVKNGKAIRFKAEVEANRPGISTAMLTDVKIKHWEDSRTNSTEGKSVLITKPITLDSAVNRAHAIIKHPKINDTQFNMSIIFGTSNDFKDMSKTTSREKNNEVIEDYEYIATDTTSNIATLKVEINQQSGTVENEVLGSGTGKQQAFKLAHHARPETLQVSGSTNWTYKEKTDTLLVTANSGNAISVSYDWIGKSNYLTALACVFNS